jgi:diguanylate cyclase (GGDEF)-like protein
MELKTYLRIMVKKWWIVIPVFLVTLTAGIVFTYNTAPVYSATTTYVVVPSPEFSGNFANGLEILARRDEIATTFAELASSRRIKGLAASSLSLQSAQDYSVESRLRAGTNIIEITVEGPAPIIASALANAVGASIEEYVQGLFEVFTLVLVDEARPPESPIRPNRPLNLTLSILFGLVLGTGLAFLSEYLETPLISPVGVNIIDENTGAYNRGYFLRRLGEEMARARRNEYSLSLALMRVDSLALLSQADSDKVSAEILRQVATLSSQYLREEDIVAHYEGDVLGLLLPDMTGEDAKALMEHLQTRVVMTPFRSSINGATINLKSSIGITAYYHNGTNRDELVAEASRALELAEVEENGCTFLIARVTPPDDNVAE